MQYRRAKVPGASYFFTVVTHERRPLFRNTEAVTLFQTGVARIQERHPFEIDAFVILPDHIHTVWTLPDGDANFSMRWRLIKEAFTKPFVRRYQPSQQDASRLSADRQARGEQEIWQRRFWEHVIRDASDYAAHIDYIHYNPVRHGLASAARSWPHSSFAAWVERGVYEPHWGSDELPPRRDWAVRGE